MARPKGIPLSAEHKAAFIAGPMTKRKFARILVRDGDRYLVDFWLVDIKNIVGEAHIPESEKHKCDKIKWVTSSELANLPQIPLVGVDIARKADRLLA